MKRIAFRRPVSIFGHALFLAVGAVLMITGLSIAILLTYPTLPTTPPVTTFDVAQILRRQPVAGVGVQQKLYRRTVPPAGPRNRTEELMTLALANQLGVPQQSVRLFVEVMPQRDIAAFEREYRDYNGDAGFNPIIFGPLNAAVRNGDGSWTVLERGGFNPFRAMRSPIIYWILGGVVLVLPLAWWFSRRLADPIRSFSASAERLGRGTGFEPVPVYGPTEIRLAATALNDMQARLQRYIRERTSVVGAIAHDLRTPLTRLNFHIAAAPENIRKSVESEIREMERMISVTLDFVQSESRIQDHQPVDLGLLVEGVVDDFSDMGMPVELVKTAVALVSGDQDLLKRLFANLIDNAIKYGGAARVSVTREWASAIILIEDDGPGMPDSDLDRAFEPFYRGEPSRSRATGGVGLGLAIVKSTAASHRGEVKLSNRVTGGLCAAVTLPELTSNLSP